MAARAAPGRLSHPPAGSGAAWHGPSSKRPARAGKTPFLARSTRRPLGPARSRSGIPDGGREQRPPARYEGDAAPRAVQRPTVAQPPRLSEISTIAAARRQSRTDRSQAKHEPAASRAGMPRAFPSAPSPAGHAVPARCAAVLWRSLPSTSRQGSCAGTTPERAAGSTANARRPVPGGTASGARSTSCPTRSGPIDRA